MYCIMWLSCVLSIMWLSCIVSYSVSNPLGGGNALFCLMFLTEEIPSFMFCASGFFSGHGDDFGSRECFRDAAADYMCFWTTFITKRREKYVKNLFYMSCKQSVSVVAARHARSPRFISASCRIMSFIINLYYLRRFFRGSRVYMLLF